MKGCAVRADEQLARGLQQGDAECLGALVDRHYAPLVGYLYRMTGERPLAEDFAQECFVRVLRAIGQYQYPRPFKSWLYQIAANITRDYFKRAAARYEMTMPDDWEMTDDEQEQPEMMVARTMSTEQALAALRTLPETQRAVILLRYDREFSLAEIAAALDIPVGTVKSRLSLGLRQLRQQMSVAEVEAE
jgi:RNA polymerase sigma factor (sigma-70 family)